MGEILMLVLNDVDQDLGGQATDLREGLLDAGDGGIQKVQETVVVERNDAHLLRNPYAKLAESADAPSRMVDEYANTASYLTPSLNILLT